MKTKEQLAEDWVINETGWVSSHVEAENLLWLGEAQDCKRAYLAGYAEAERQHKQRWIPWPETEQEWEAFPEFGKLIMVKYRNDPHWPMDVVRLAEGASNEDGSCQIDLIDSGGFVESPDEVIGWMPLLEGE